MVERLQMKLEHDWICARPDLKGDWVRHSDYEALRTELEQVKQTLAIRDHESDFLKRRGDKAVKRAEAAERLAGARVKVKPLEWVELNEGKAFRALLPVIGSIRIEPYGVCGWWEVLWSMPGQCEKLIPDVFDTPDEAKAAAQADYERRILSALAEPAGEAEPVAWKVEWGFRKGPDVAFAGGGTGIYEDEISADKHIEKLNAYDGTDWVRKTPLYTTPPDASAIRGALESDQWSIIDRAIERYSNGEISDLHALGLITSGFLKLDAERLDALAGAKP